jgi:hypothetical protein
MKNRIPVALLAFAMGATPGFAGTPEEDLLEAIRQSDVAAVRKLLDGGVSANAKYRYDRSALSFAADRGNVEIVKLLLDRGADAGAKDTYYKMTPLSAASMKGNAEVVRLLLARRPQDAGSALSGGVFGKKPEVVAAVLATAKPSARDLSYLLEAADRVGSSDAATLLRQAGAVPPPPATFVVTPAALARYAGVYRADEEELRVTLADGSLTATYKSSGYATPLAAIGERLFLQKNAMGMTLEFQLEGSRVVALEAASIGQVTRFERAEEAK